MSWYFIRTNRKKLISYGQHLRLPYAAAIPCVLQQTNCTAEMMPVKGLTIIDISKKYAFFIGFRVAETPFNQKKKPVGRGYNLRSLD